MDFLINVRYNNIIPIMEEIRMNFGETICALRKGLGLTQDEVAKRIGVKKNTISNYENNVSKPQYEQLVKLCNLFKRNPNILMSSDLVDIDMELNLSPVDQTILDKYKALTPHDKEIVDNIFNMNPEEPIIIYRFPVYEQQAAAGAGKYGREGKYHMKDLQIANLSNHAVFGVEISGNSMEKNDNPDCGIKNGATVLLNPNFDELEIEGRVVVFKINSTNEVFCKRYFKEENTIGFISDNDECSEMDKHLTTGEYTIIGEVVNVINP